MDKFFYKNLYEILGLEPTDDIGKIKSVYRSLARKYHPDLNGGNNSFTEKFKEISQAYEILTNKEKKSLYDTYKGYSFGNSAEEFEKRKERAYKYSKETKSEFTEQPRKNAQSKTKFSEAFSEVVNDLFKNKKNAKSMPEKKNGSDINTEVTISYREALTGTSRTVNILHTEICPNCKGKLFINEAKCPLCKGSGENSIHKKINVKIPQNIKENTKIRIAGEGNRGKNGGKNGDLYLTVKIKNEKNYSNDGLNVNLETTIYPQEAYLGADVKIDTPQGSVSMKIPPNTQQGEKFRISKHGIKDENGKTGDAIVTVRIALPENLSDTERELYEKLAKERKPREE